MSDKDKIQILKHENLRLQLLLQEYEKEVEVLHEVINTMRETARQYKTIQLEDL